jgi:hypothetical protein
MRHNDHGPVDDPNFVNDKPYETREFFTMGTVFKSLFFLFVFVGATSVLTWGIFRLMVPTNSERTTAFPLPQERALPREPRLQANPMLEISDFRAQENAALTGYGRDPKTGDLHIPVDRAIELVLQEGLPTRPDPGKINPQEPDQPSYTEGDAPPGTPANLPRRRAMPNDVGPSGGETTGMGAPPTTPGNSGPRKSRGER